MKTIVAPEIEEVLHAVHYKPAISIIMPFEPKMTAKSVLHHSLDAALARAAKELDNNYPEDLRELVMYKLKNLVEQLNYNTHKKSIAIFVSPVFEKVLYLDIAVEEKMIIDESFEIRDLVYARKQLHNYLVLLISAKASKMFLNSSDQFVRILSSSPDAINTAAENLHERVANFEDVQQRREIEVDKFLRYVDNGLDLILNAYKLPLFVAGADKMLGHFKKITRHQKSVIEYIHGNYEDEPVEKIQKILQPYVNDWKNVRQKDLLNLLSEAESKKKLVYGIQNVWYEAMRNRGKLLVVEKYYMYPSKAEEQGIGDIPFHNRAHRKFSYVKDAVDDIIEKVLENGGDVEFTDAEVLKGFDQIALIQYY